MENKKTIEDLNNSVWYRGLKVVFIILLLLGLGFVNYVLIGRGIMEIDNDQTLIYCNYGNKEPFSPEDIGVKLTKYNFTAYGEFIDENHKIVRTCDDSFYANPPYNKNTYTALKNAVFEIKPVYTNWKFIMNLVFTNLLIILFFEILKRIFYYIVLGKVIPKK